MIFSIEDVQAILAERFGLRDYAVTALPSERDQNFRVSTGHVLKIANIAETRRTLEAENAALCRLQGLCPQVAGALDGSDISLVQGHLVRLVTLLPGVPMGKVRHQTVALLRDVGASLARLTQGLAGFDHPALHRPDFHWDLAHALQVLDTHPAPQLKEIAVLRRNYEQHALPLLPRLRRSVIHNDGNDYNILVEGEAVSGWIDLGDMVHSHTINDLAIAMAYACLGKRDPVDAMLQVVRGYNGVLPIPEEELPALYSLACMRLCVSASIAMKQQAERPDDPYLGISQAPIRATLPVLAALHPRLAHFLIREACGLEPVPQAKAIRNWLGGQPDFVPILGACQNAVPVDLGVESPLVSSEPGQNAPEPLWRRMAARIHKAKAEFGVGGYGEVRLLYTSAAFGTDGHETRTVHLGLDCSAGAGTPVHAPLAGVVHGFEDAAEALDYGPVIVLRHDCEAGQFFTLYGHLSRESLRGLEPGMQVAKGQRLGFLGTPDENGGWWPHVHFQLILDLLDTPCNFPGAALPSRRATWLSLCPDPNLILRLPQPVPGPDRAEVAALRRVRIGGNLSVSYASDPVQAVRGWMQYLFDANGRRYLDAYNNVPHVGHCHPRVVQAVSEQLAMLNTNTRYLQRQLTDYAEALTATLPSALQVCFFTASGSEANELALRLARAHNGALDLLVMDAAYHGHTTTLIDISPYKHEGPGGQGAPEWVIKTPIPDVYRGQYRDLEQAGAQYAARVGEAIEGRRICGYIAETCPSVGGQMLLPRGYLPEVYRLVRQAGGVCIADEVQTGFGRIGTHFWAFEQHGVVPDIVVLGKPIANGYPMGAVVCTAEIARSFDNGMEYFSTFGGSTAALVAARETLRVTIDEGLQAHALCVGDQLLAGLRSIRHPLIGDVRGSGLFVGVELVREGQRPAAREASTAALRMREEGILLGTDGPFHNVVKIRGPMPFDSGNAAELVETFRRILEEF
jgi:4-aminobutyrate aminotransferase-like enzyme/Ser/Thr protein kinase RdoA (MazF antagonist)